MTALQEVAQVAKREPALTYSLKHPHLIIPTLHPALYPHYSPAQRALVQQLVVPENLLLDQDLVDLNATC